MRSPHKSRPRFGIVAGRFNDPITKSLVAGAMKAFQRHGVKRAAVDLIWVPGAFELPVAALKMARSRRYRAIVAVGCILAGETPQFEFLSNAVFQGLTTAGLLTGVPVACGVITAKRWKHAVERAGLRGLNRGGEAAEAAWEMAHLWPVLGHAG
ncbi:MAG: 6,7-dimethyl-8-ribityllumazine synthase [Candidatus Omnitrophica bacterium]|nr:6,7-dimethyl-8-ribityllumazine synthase [Candidatus Omnitrophota bacterium]